MVPAFTLVVLRITLGKYSSICAGCRSNGRNFSLFPFFIHCQIHPYIYYDAHRMHHRWDSVAMPCVFAFRWRASAKFPPPPPLGSRCALQCAHPLTHPPAPRNGHSSTHPFLTPSSFHNSSSSPPSHSGFFNCRQPASSIHARPTHQLHPTTCTS